MSWNRHGACPAGRPSAGDRQRDDVGVHLARHAGAVLVAPGGLPPHGAGGTAVWPSSLVNIPGLLRHAPTLLLHRVGHRTRPRHLPAPPREGSTTTGSPRARPSSSSRGGGLRRGDDAVRLVPRLGARPIAYIYKLSSDDGSAPDATTGAGSGTVDAAWPRAVGLFRAAQPARLTHGLRPRLRGRCVPSRRAPRRWITHLLLAEIARALGTRLPLWLADTLAEEHITAASTTACSPSRIPRPDGMWCNSVCSGHSTVTWLSSIRRRGRCWRWMR